jgi:3-hydroxy acid dehydrogenase/malonic semialdehyde reductase
MLKNKIVLVTGGSSGIGRSTALAFAQQGAHIIIAARRTQKLLDLKQEILQLGVRCKEITLDVRNRQSVFDTVASLDREWEEIDILVNNAGLVIGTDPVESVGEEAMNTMLDTNVKGLLNTTQAVLLGMKKRNRGHIIHISSISGTQVYPGGGMYCATKHAVDALTKTLRMELVNTRKLFTHSSY